MPQPKELFGVGAAPSCIELLEKEIAKPVSDYLTDPEGIAAATIRLVTTAVSKEQKQ